MFECKVCGTEIPDGAAACPSCRVHQEPPAKFMHGALVKLTLEDEGVVYYNYITDSYFNQEIQMRMYRVNERIAMPVWREDWLQPVSQEEIERINATGLLEPRKNGGWQHPIMEGVNKLC